MGRFKQVSLLLAFIGSFCIASEQKTLLFEENFDRIENISRQWHIQSGQWAISEKSLRVDSLEGDAFLFFDIDTWGNCIIEADVTFHKVLNSGRWVSIIFRANREDQMLWSQCPLRFKSTLHNGVEFAVRKNNSWHVRRTASAPDDSTLGMPRRMKVIVQGTQVEAFVDNIPVLKSFYCVERSQGYIGLGASGCIAAFDNLKVTPLSDVPEHSNSTDSERLTLWVAHRGCSSVAPENTLVALNEAVKRDMDGVEFDLRMTKDGTPVLLHDSKVDRTTNGSGKIGSLVIQQVKKLDAGSWKHKRYQKEPVPTLNEALNLLESTGKMIVIDIKDSKVTSDIIAQISQRSLFEKTYIFSSDGDILSHIHSKNPAFNTVWLCRYLPNQVATEFQKGQWLEDQAKKHNVGVLSLHYSILSPEIVHYLQSKNFQVWAWTINDPDVGHALLKWGADVIITDHFQLKNSLRNIAIEAKTHDVGK